MCDVRLPGLLFEQGRRGRTPPPENSPFRSSIAQNLTGKPQHCGGLLSGDVEGRKESLQRLAGCQIVEQHLYRNTCASEHDSTADYARRLAEHRLQGWLYGFAFHAHCLFAAQIRPDYTTTQ